MDNLMRPDSFDNSVRPMISPPNRWKSVKSVLFFGVAGGILGATIGSAIQALTGARLAVWIGGIPLAIIGSFALGWYGVLFGFCEQAPIWRDARFCPRIARRRFDWVGLRVVCSDLAIELGGCPHRRYPGLEPDCPAPTFPQTLPWDCPGNLWGDSRRGFPKGPRPRSARGHQGARSSGSLRGSGLCWL